MLALALLPALAWSGRCHAESAGDGEVKMVLVYKFSRFIEWPSALSASTQKQFTLCTLGAFDAYQSGAAAIEGRPVQGRELHVRRLASSADLSGCQVLFLADIESRRLPGMLAAAHALSILTVSDADQFIENGGIVGLTTSANRVQFNFNLKSARTANLRISPDLLRLASNVIGGEHN